MDLRWIQYGLGLVQSHKERSARSYPQNHSVNEATVLSLPMSGLVHVVSVCVCFDASESPNYVRLGNLLLAF